jgi:hypothetical protein
MPKYARDFFKSLPIRQRVEFQKLVKSGTAYLERAPDGSQYLVVLDPARLDEAVFARLPETVEVTCVRNRVR